MKKYLSVFMMCARQSIYKVSFLAIAVMALELKLFMDELAYYREQYNTSLAQIIDASCSDGVFVIGWIALIIILSNYGCKSKQGKGYLFRRLQISQRHIWVVQSIYNVGCFIFLWAMQVAGLLIMAKMYAHTLDEMVNHQTFFLTCYRSDFARMLLPLESIIGWVILVYFILVSSVVASFIVCAGKGEE